MSRRVELVGGDRLESRPQAALVEAAERVGQATSPQPLELGPVLGDARADGSAVPDELPGKRHPLGDLPEDPGHPPHPRMRVASDSGSSRRCSCGTQAPSVTAVGEPVIVYSTWARSSRRLLPQAV